MFAAASQVSIYPSHRSGHPGPGRVTRQLVERACAEDASEKVILLLRDTLDAIDSGRPSARETLALAYALLEAERSSRGGTASAEADPGGLAPWQMQRAVAYVESRLEHQITVGDLARVTNLSANYFGKAFKRSFRTTPHIYIFNRRIERAQELMLTTNEPLSQIAYACGFSDQGHFSRRFRRATGAAPLAWRRERLRRPTTGLERSGPTISTHNAAQGRQTAA